MTTVYLIFFVIGRVLTRLDSTLLFWRLSRVSIRGSSEKMYLETFN